MSSTIPARLRSQVHSLDEGRCAYCQTPEELAVTTFEIDHIVPVSAGGETVPDAIGIKQRGALRLIQKPARSCLCTIHETRNGPRNLPGAEMRPGL